MATDAERLLIRLEVTQAKFEKQLAKANGTVNRRARAMEQRFQKMNKNISLGAARMGGAFIAAFASVAALRGAQALVDASTRISNALKVAGLSGTQLTQVYDQLFASAQRNAAPLESLVSLYSRAALSQKELGITTQELLKFTDNVAIALRVAGTSAGASSGALLQLAQAMGSGVVRAEEFNSLLEGALPIAQAAAAGLKEAGGSVSKLRTLVIDGKVSSEAFFRAFEAGASTLEEKVSAAELTVSQRFVRLQNVLTDVAGKLNKTTGASDKTGIAIDTLATAVVELGDFMERAANGPVGRFLGYIGDLDDKAKQLLKTLKKFTLIDEVANAAGDLANAAGNFIAPDPKKRPAPDIGGLQAKLNALRDDRQNGGSRNEDLAKSLGFGSSDIDRQILELENQLVAAYRATSTPGSRGARRKPGKKKVVSLKDYDPPDGDGDGDGDKKERLDSLQREIRGIEERTAAIQVGIAAQSGLNPLIYDYGFAMERAAAVQELLAAAQRAGVAVTPQLRAQIEALAEGYAASVVQAEKLAESQDLVRQRAADMADFGRDALGGFINDMRNGVTAAESLANALDKVIDRLLDSALDGLFGGGSTKGNGFLGDLLGSVFGVSGGGMSGGSDPWAGLRYAKGGVVRQGRDVPLKRFAGGGVSDRAAIFGEAGPEAAVPLPDGRRIPVDLNPGAMRRGGSETIHIKLQADSSLVAEIADQRIQTASGQIVQVSVQKARELGAADFAGNQIRTRTRRETR